MCSQSWPGCALLPVWLFSRSERDVAMDSLENVFLFLDYLTDTKRKRHVGGGVLMSVSLFFGGLAFTFMSIKGEDNEQNDS